MQERRTQKDKITQGLATGHFSAVLHDPYNGLTTPAYNL